MKKIIGRLQKATYFIVQTGALIVCTDTWQKSLHFLFISNFLPYWEPAWSQFLISLTVTRLKLTPKSTEFGATFLILHILYNWRYDASNFDKMIIKGWQFEKKVLIKISLKVCRSKRYSSIFSLTLKFKPKICVTDCFSNQNFQKSTEFRRISLLSTSLRSFDWKSWNICGIYSGIFQLIW